MKKKIKNVFLLLLNICIINGLEECDFEQDECGWYSGGDVGAGSFIRTSSEEQQDQGSDLYPTPNIEEKGTDYRMLFTVLQSRLHHNYSPTPKII